MFFLTYEVRSAKIVNISILTDEEIETQENEVGNDFPVSA